jgi:ribosome assembly protein RRB1
MPQEPHIVATWSELGTVNLFNVTDMVKALDVPPTGKLPDPLVKELTAHKTEGFAMAWSPLVPGRFFLTFFLILIFFSDY